MNIYSVTASFTVALMTLLFQPLMRKMIMKTARMAKRTEPMKPNALREGVCVGGRERERVGVCVCVLV